MSIDFVDLHVHSEFSLLDGVSSPEDMVQRAKELGRKAHALTDHGSVSGHLIFEKAARAVGIKPIYGCEFYSVIDIKAMKEQKIRKKYHLTVLAKNLEGYRNLNKLVTESWDDGFYYRPTIDYEMLLKYHKGLIVLSGCESGFLMDSLSRDDLDTAQYILDFNKQVWKDDFYLEIQHFPFVKNKTRLGWEISQLTGIPPVLTCDSHYLTEDGWKQQQFLWSVRDREIVTSESRYIEYAYLWEPQKLFDFCKLTVPDVEWQGVFENTVSINEKIDDYKIPKASNVVFPYNGNKPALIRDMCLSRLEQEGLIKTEYLDRLDYELNMIINKGYEDYFLMVADVVNWAKSQGIYVGVARGSCAGSLVCYGMRITEVNPIPFGLIFERFIDVTRTDMPDIDCDFEDERRGEVIEYIKQKYGDANVSFIATFSRFGGRSALDDVARSYRIPKFEIDTVKKYLTDRSSGDQREALSIQDAKEISTEAKDVFDRYPDLNIAIDIQGKARHLGRHAAGVLILSEPIEKYMAVYKLTTGDRVVAVDWEGVKALNMMKFDVLGLKELAILRMMAEKVGMTMDDVYKIPLDDPATLEGFNKYDYLGIFQFTGSATQQVAKRINFKNFMHVSDVNALARPGPLHCLDGETVIYDWDNKEFITMAKAYKRKIKRTLSLFPDGSVGPQEIKQFHRIGSWKQNKQKVYRVKLQDDKGLVSTDEHWYMTDKGWKKLSDLVVGDNVVCSKKNIWNRGIKGSVKANSGSFQKGSVPWNKGIEWPELAEIKRKQWADGLYDDVDTGFKQLCREQPNLVKIYAKRGSEASSAKLALMSPEEKRIYLANWIEAGSINGYGKTGFAEDGHRYESSFELALEEWLIENDIPHIPHPRLSNNRKADQLVCGVYIELDGMDRSQEYWDLKYENGEPYIVIDCYKQFNFEEILSPIFEKQTNRNWESISVSPIVSIEYLGERVVYDLEMKEVPNYIANGIVVHNSGSTEGYIQGKEHGNIKLLFPQFEVASMLDDTYGQIVYQEQVMKILREVGDLDWQDVCALRDIISKAFGSEKFDEWLPKWLEGTKRKGLPEPEARTIWETVKLYGKHGFNKAHSVAYGLIAWSSMWFKVHYPQLFYWAHLVKAVDKDDELRFIREALSKGITFLPFSYSMTGASWYVVGDTISPGWRVINGIGEVASTELAKHAPFTDLDHIVSVCSKRVINAKIRGAIEELMGTDIESYYGLDVWQAVLKKYKNRTPIAQCNIDNQTYTVVGKVLRINKKNRIEEYTHTGKSLDRFGPNDVHDYAILIAEDDSGETMLYVTPEKFVELQDVIYQSQGKFVKSVGKKASNIGLLSVNSLEIVG